MAFLDSIYWWNSGSPFTDHGLPQKERQESSPHLLYPAYWMHNPNHRLPQTLSNPVDEQAVVPDLAACDDCSEPVDIS